MPRRGVRSFALVAGKIAVRAPRTPFASHTRKRSLSSPRASRRVFFLYNFCYYKVHGTDGDESDRSTFTKAKLMLIIYRFSQNFSLSLSLLFGLILSDTVHHTQA